MEFRIVTIPTLQLKGLMQEDNATGHTHGVPIFPKGVLMRVRPTCNPSRLAVNPFHPAPHPAPIYGARIEVFALGEKIGRPLAFPPDCELRIPPVIPVL